MRLLCIGCSRSRNSAGDREIQSRDREIQSRDREIQSRDRGIQSRDRGGAAIRHEVCASSITAMIFKKIIFNF